MATSVTKIVTVDTTIPTCSISGNPTAWQNTNGTLTVTMSDANVNSNGYKWDSGSYGSTKTLTVTQNGSHTAYVKDLA